MFVRKPVAAGAFYPADAEELKDYMHQVIKHKIPKIKPKAIIVPHAGYIYSGQTAAKAFGMIDDFDVYIVLGPNHTGLGKEISVFEGAYEIPFGTVETDNELGELLVHNSSVDVDYYAHLQEHSIEVQLPFIDFISKKPYKIVPIVIGTHNREKLRHLGMALAEAIKNYRKDILIVVSSDMNHYENQDTTIKKDELAIKALENLDEEEFFNRVEQYDISMCGAAASYAAVVAAKLLGAKEARLIEHTTSGDVNGDYDQVVGYASIIIE